MNGYDLHAHYMRCNSAISDRSWLAEIVGADAKWGFQRKFERSVKHQRRSTVDGFQIWENLTEGSVYEYRDISEEWQSGHNYNREGGLSGFFKIIDGQMVSVKKDEVLKT